MYSRATDDLGNCPTYGRFLTGLKHVFSECKRVLKPGGYVAIVVSDFRDRITSSCSRLHRARSNA